MSNEMIAIYIYMYINAPVVDLDIILVDKREFKSFQMEMKHGWKFAKDGAVLSHLDMRVDAHTYSMKSTDIFSSPTLHTAHSLNICLRLKYTSTSSTALSHAISLSLSLHLSFSVLSNHVYLSHVPENQNLPHCIYYLHLKFLPLYSEQRSRRSWGSPVRLVVCHRTSPLASTI